MLPLLARALPVRNLGIARLSVEQRAGRSVVASQYSQAPLQLHTPLYLDGASYPTMFLRSPSAGFLDGDEHRLHVEVLEGASLELRTQAASLIYPGVSEQHITINIASGGKLLFHPHPLILARDAQFTQRILINLSGNAVLDFQDSWSCGRVAMSERWMFEKFDNQAEIFRDATLVYRDRAVISPKAHDLTSPFLCGTNNNFATRYQVGLNTLPVNAIGAMTDYPPQFHATNSDKAESWMFRRMDILIERMASRGLAPSST